MRTLTLTILLLLLLAASGCISFSGGEVGSPLFIANFRDGGTFPHEQPSDDVLLLDVSDRADWLNAPPVVHLRIDGALVASETLPGGGRHEIPFPPAAWAETAGAHDLEVQMGDIARSLPFTWAD